MQDKEGKQFKPNSLYQIFRRLGYFPTLQSAPACFGFENSRTFMFDDSRRYVQHTKARTNKIEQPAGAGCGGIV